MLPCVLRRDKRDNRAMYHCKCDASCALLFGSCPPCELCASRVGVYTLVQRVCVFYARCCVSCARPVGGHVGNSTRQCSGRARVARAESCGEAHCSLEKSAVIWSVRRAARARALPLVFSVSERRRHHVKLRFREILPYL